MKLGTTESAKFKKLKRRLKQPAWAVIGVLEAVWYFTCRNSPCGDIGRHSNEDIAADMEWDDDADELIDALVYAGFLDLSSQYRLVVHDWPEHCPNWVRANIVRHKKQFCVAEDSTKQAIDDTKEPPKESPIGTSHLFYSSQSNPIDSNSINTNPSIGVGGEGRAPPAFDRKILDPINFDPWLQAFLPMWDATPGVVKQGSQISEMERREIEKRLADPWWEKNWRRALEMFPLPWFQSQGNLVGLLSFLEDGFVQKVCQRKYHNKWSKPSSKRESKVDEIVDVISQVQEMQDRRESAANPGMRRLT